MLCMHGFSWLPADDLINEMVINGSGSSQEVCVCVSAARIDNQQRTLPNVPLAGKR
jgi:hypothetical protein